jgi:hypothetical protein
VLILSINASGLLMSDVSKKRGAFIICQYPLY